MSSGSLTPQTDDPRTGTHEGPPTSTTVVELYQTEDGWEATQTRIGIVGEGETAARAVEDYGRKVAERKEGETDGE